MSSSTIGTFSGLRVDPLNLQPEDIHIVDIAHSLSMQCRFGGHVSEFYSVAQHCVNVSYAVPEEDALWGLLHDASEAYLKDIPSPLKKTAMFEGYRKLEASVQEKIAEAFELAPEMPASVHEADAVELLTEGFSLHPSYGEWWRSNGLSSVQPRAEKIIPMSPAEAEEAFLQRFCELLDRSKV